MKRVFDKRVGMNSIIPFPIELSSERGFNGFFYMYKLKISNRTTSFLPSFLCFTACILVGYHFVSLVSLEPQPVVLIKVVFNLF